MTQHENAPSSLLKAPRFAPFFWTQFAGAFNDNIFKNVLMLLLAFRAAQPGQTDILMNLAAGLFILPFFLFSSLAGQIADKYEKGRLIRMIKVAEIGIMCAGAAALLLGSTASLLALLFLMGTQSAFFGPVKYSIMPQHLDATEIVGGNALVEMGTFVAILAGTIAGGLLIQVHSVYAALAVIATAVAGWLASRKIPEAPAASPDLAVNWNIFSQTVRTLGYAKKEKTVFLSVLGISWFWFLGACYVTQIPAYTKNVLHSTEGVATLLLAMFSIGIGAGSMLCEYLSGKKVEYGLVPIGSLGLSLFGIHLAAAGSLPVPEVPHSLMGFLAAKGSLPILFDLVLIGIFGGLYIVPLFAIVQTRSDESHRSRVIAANNILNALFMVGAALLGGVFLGPMGLSIPTLFLTITLMNIAVAVYIYTLVPEFTMRCLVWVITHLFYRIHHEHLDKIPAEGPAVIVCNHVSYMDALIIGSCCRRPVRFVMDKGIFGIPVLNFIFRTGKTIPITAKRKDPEVYEAAFQRIAEELEDGQVVCIFPEGKLTRDGEIDTFKNGIEKIIRRTPAPVIPTALKGLWGSFFSHKDGTALVKRPRRLYSKIHYTVGDAVAPEHATAEGLHSLVLNLRGDHA
ncbi:MFS transporter [Desulfoluna spongiiphila]|uniref:1-acyl-sn-glycerol-3-phosphate acyltransferases n=1 Tax=Desulfoluna spongiiphila TaxID=419481 RepID=A0A1G5ANE2_9BACT|nr:MFS transporter [Desulfoluna spongiiphila]SCX79419.1 1-acyl-sn-glycerol-3-phosphate acyltransferases [Desulfoluna spongiiphila]